MSDDTPTPSKPCGTDRLGDGRFAKGNPGGPGRPRGNAVTRSAAELDELGADIGRELMNVVIEQARAGNLKAAEIVLSRIWPARRGRPLAVDATPLKTIEDLVPAATSLTHAVLKGDVTPDEGRAFASLMGMQCDLFTLVDFDRRLRAVDKVLEERERRERRERQ